MRKFKQSRHTIVEKVQLIAKKSLIAQQDRNRTANRRGKGLTSNVVRAPKMLSDVQLSGASWLKAHIRSRLSNNMNLDQSREPLLTARDAADRLRLSLSWLAKARMRGDGPPFVKLGRSVRYGESALAKWSRSRTQSRLASARRAGVFRTITQRFGAHRRELSDHEKCRDDKRGGKRIPRKRDKTYPVRGCRQCSARVVHRAGSVVRGVASGHIVAPADFLPMRSEAPPGSANTTLISQLKVRAAQQKRLP